MEASADEWFEYPATRSQWQPRTELQFALKKAFERLAPILLAEEEGLEKRPLSEGIDECDWSKPPPVFTHVDDANECIEQLWKALGYRLRNVQALSTQIASNSSNSSRPPSHDSIAMKAKRQAQSTHRSSGRKPGAQPGHPGRTLFITYRGR